MANDGKGLIVRFAERYGIVPNSVLETLKSTAFKVDKPISNEQMMALMIVAERHGLDPFTREIFAFPDSKSGGIVPVVSVDGWARIINEHPMLDGFGFLTAIDGSECTCTMYRKDRSHPIVVTEYRDECRRNTAPWQSHPRRMLRHKTLIQCARLAFGFAGIYDEDEAARIAEAPRSEPTSAGAAAVRHTLAMVEEVAAPGPTAAPDEFGPLTYAELVQALASAPTADDAAIVLDLARGAGITDAQLLELAEMFRAKHAPTTEPE